MELLRDCNILGARVFVHDNYNSLSVSTGHLDLFDTMASIAQGKSMEQLGPLSEAEERCACLCSRRQDAACLSAPSTRPRGGSYCCTLLLSYHRGCIEVPCLRSELAERYDGLVPVFHVGNHGGANMQSNWPNELPKPSVQPSRAA